VFLLDTNVVSELRRGERCNVGVAAWYAGAQDADLFISVLVIGEIRKGIEIVRRRQDYRHAEILAAVWLETLRGFFSDRLLPVDSSIADAWGELYAIRNVPIIDGLIAATAKVYNLTLVTRDVADVRGLGADALNPFTI
jgi:predicted nucleic acid-binding protein